MFADETVTASGSGGGGGAGDAGVVLGGVRPALVAAGP